MSLPELLHRRALPEGGGPEPQQVGWRWMERTSPAQSVTSRFARMRDAVSGWARSKFENDRFDMAEWLGLHCAPN